jgi:hypothetical protein
MEQILTLKVDLEHPDDAKFAIDEAAKAYEAEKFKWTAEELAEAKRLAMQIMQQLCLDGYSISWCKVESYGLHSISVWLELEENKRTDCTCSISSSKWDVWIAKCVCLCRATGRDVPAFIIKKGW